jgi:ubiquinone/menaquinone biosynthesis C-methylase UbiE
MIINAESPFDTLASTYDADFTGSNIGRLQRERVWSFLQGLLIAKQGSLKIMEINCGTGEDAVRLALLGHKVIAADASAAMIEKAKEKSASYPIDLPVQFVVCSFEQLSALFANEQFDLVFSNFGGLNCIDQTALEQLSKDLYALIKPGGHLFFVIMGRCCLWEIFYYGTRGKLRTALRKFRKSVNFTVNGTTIPVHYYSPAIIKKIFTTSFSFLQQHPVGLFIPPSYLEKKFELRPRWLDRLNRLEKSSGYSFLSLFADHFCINFKKPVT